MELPARLGAVEFEGDKVFDALLILFGGQFFTSLPLQTRCRRVVEGSSKGRRRVVEGSDLGIANKPSRSTLDPGPAPHNVTFASERPPPIHTNRETTADAQRFRSRRFSVIGHVERGER
jgi:hypothetical protein